MSDEYLTNGSVIVTDVTEDTARLIPGSETCHLGGLCWLKQMVFKMIWCVLEDGADGKVTFTVRVLCPC